MKWIDGEQLHKWYLEATHKLSPESFNPNAQKPYSELTDEQKFIDKYISDRISQRLLDVLPGTTDDDFEIMAHEYYKEGYREAIKDLLERLKGGKE